MSDNIDQVFELSLPPFKRIPLLVSVPHAGVRFPDELKSLFFDSVIDCPSDTDWFVDQLYDFVPEIGGTLIKANYSRYVVDLNRSKQGEFLYGDERKETALVPIKTFSEDAIYKGKLPDDQEINRRIVKYYDPYYEKIKLEIARLKEEFGSCLFFDAHSIRRFVPSIRKNRFPDFILGDADSKTARISLVEKAKKLLEESEYSFSYNDPFKGGMLTRNFGDPKKNIHALQLEMSQDIYMDETNLKLDEKKASRVKALFKKLLTGLAEELL